MIRKYALPIAAVCGVVFAIYTVIAGSKPIPASAPVTQPASGPFTKYIAGAGIVESSTEDIAVGTPVAGIVAEIFAKVGADVKQGEPLFRIDDRELQAELKVKQAALQSAREALRSAEVQLADDKNKWAMWSEIKDNAVSKEEMDTRRFAVEKSAAKRDEASANIASAEAAVGQVKTEIERRIVRAPVDGTVLQTKVRLGEFAPAGVTATPLMLFGNVKVMHVRTDIDENDAWRLSKQAKACACVRGNNKIGTQLELVRVEPFVVPKRSLTGSSSERVDTRVLQVLYRFDRNDLPIYVGQQMDVFIEDVSR
jgi:RND family efflux transporter MFP subunit